MKMSSKISVVVCGMDSRSRLWPAFKHGFDKYWPDCPWPKYFITNRLEGPSGFTTIRTGVEVSWGDKTIVALSQIQSELILWMMEDFWLPGMVQNKALTDFYKIMMKHNNIDHIRLMPPCMSTEIITPEKELTGPSEFDNRLWYFKDDAEYRASVTASFWRRDALLSYIKDYMDPWKFEQEASIMSMFRKTLYLCIVDPFIFPIPHYTNPYQQYKNEMVSKGTWNVESAYEYIKKENLTMDFSRHPDGTRNELFPYMRR